MRRCWNLSRGWESETVLVLDNLSRGLRNPGEKKADDWIVSIPGFPGGTPLADLTGFSGRTVNGWAPGISDSGFLESIAVIDQRSARIEHLRILAEYATPLLLDDNGPARQYAPFLLDLLPGPRRSEANIASPAYLDLPPKTREPDTRSTILVSFGGEDPADLVSAVLNCLVHSVKIAPERISVILAPDKARRDRLILPDGIHVLEPTNTLKSRLAEFGLVICSYGLTAWEALASGSAVLTVEPGVLPFPALPNSSNPQCRICSPGKNVKTDRSGETGPTRRTSPSA